LTARPDAAIRAISNHHFPLDTAHLSRITAERLFFLWSLLTRAVSLHRFPLSTIVKQHVHLGCTFAPPPPLIKPMFVRFNALQRQTEESRNCRTIASFRPFSDATRNVSCDVLLDSFALLLLLPRFERHSLLIRTQTSRVGHGQSRGANGIAALIDPRSAAEVASCKNRLHSTRSRRPSKCITNCPSV
jgi:hypothetical protein